MTTMTTNYVSVNRMTFDQEINQEQMPRGYITEGGRRILEFGAVWWCYCVW